METAKGRGARSNATGRYEPEQHQSFDDGWSTQDQQASEQPLPPQTQVIEAHVKSILTGNDSPDIGFSQSINPYVHCEHG